MISIGIVGLGRRGKQHLDALRAHNDLRLFVHDPELEQTDCPCGVQHCSSYERLLENSLDGVVLASPDSLHFPQALEAVRRDIPVLIEKPSAVSAKQARQLAVESSRRGVAVYVGYQGRMFSTYQRARDLIRPAGLNEINSVHCAIYTGVGEHMKYTSRLFYNIGSHFVDCLRYLVSCSMTVASSSMVLQGGMESSGCATLLLGGLTPCYITFAFDACVFPELCESKIVFFTKRGTLLLSRHAMQFINSAAGEIEECRQDDCGDRFVLEFVKALRGLSVDVLCAIEDDVPTLALLDSIYKKRVIL